MDSKANLRLQIQPQLLQYSNGSERLSSAGSAQPSPVALMSGSPISATEPVAPVNSAWMTPPTSEPRRRPAPLYQNTSCCVGDECSTMPNWDSFSIQHGPGGAASRPVSVGHDMMSMDMPSNGEWPQKSVEESMDFHGLEQEPPIGQAYTTDDAVPILDLRYPESAQDPHAYNLDSSLNRRRMSGSSLTTSGAMSDLPSYDDFSAALSEAPSYGSDYPGTSNRNSMMSSIHMSPVVSPRLSSHGRSEQVVRTQSRGRATPSPRPSMRSVPYSIEVPKNQRWSTGSFAPSQNRRQSPFIYNAGSPEVYGVPQRMSYQGPPPNFSSPQQPLGLGAFSPGAPSPYMMSGQPMYQRSGMLLSSQLTPHSMHHDAGHFDQPPPLPSQGLFKMLQSNGDPHTLHGHYTDLSDPPDLFAALHEEQIPPPEEDMNPSDPDLIPYEQELRFEGDLYTPRWVRGHGNKREGWCGICKPGRWLVLKNSAFWYDKSFTHGISAATGSPFQQPLETRRMDGNPDVWEGLCGSCNDWVALVSSKKKGTTWFRHAYKCHSHPKVKDGPKRRREASGGRAAGSRSKQRSETPETAGMSMPMMETPTSAPMPPIHPQLRNPTHMPQVFTTQPLRLPGSGHPASLAASAGSLGNMV
ncbi:hypothetical protein HIM_07695 [Hirsutella minnesotensis 3608]|uniref:Transcription regulator Rua1 C-terminal domain-containing protein n=1 Tax=Hirsutella minnesotensis 3608 TaxID=1043627 RepID=A0A0F7ZYR5_9HYPO|nr:hypothetical protein HIM_07695 [Hirsutella minnesotensis 3608]